MSEKMANATDLAMRTNQHVLDSPLQDPTHCDKENMDTAFFTLADRIKNGRRRNASQKQQQQQSLTTLITTSKTQMDRNTTSSLAKPQKRRHAYEDSEQPGSQRRKPSPAETIVTAPVYKTAATMTDPPSPHIATTIASSVLKTEELRPINDTAGSEDFVAQVIKALRIRVNQKVKLYGDRQNATILHLLEKASAANDSEMLFLSGAEAAEKLSTGVFHNGPILTEGQQPLPLQTCAEFLGEFYDDESKVYIQDPSVKIAGGALFAREVTIGAVKRRLLEGKSKGRPWNCLELATHVEDGLRPSFLSGEDLRLLAKIKLEQNDHSYAGRRSYPQGYKEVEKWALLAESGALTEPHQDSHGYSTYITVNQGTIGFGWLSYPSQEERAAWISDPRNIEPDRFRHIALKPGQTVFFPAGTIHFVFRLPSAGHTLAFGGHVLRCSNIVHWVKCLLEEKANTNITNEDLTSSAPGYLDRVEKFVRQAQKNGTTDKWGGPDAVEEFLRLKAEFMAT